jgi:effector-binding domain-containing protein
MELSKKAIVDLRKAIIKSYGEDLSNKLNDEELNEIGNALLTVTAEALKIKMRDAKNEEPNQESK